MIHPFRQAALAAACALACAGAHGASATPTEPASVPVEAFFDSPVVKAPRLSPSGDALAVLMVVDGHRVLARSCPCT